MSLNSIGHMSFLLHAIWLITCHHLCWITKSPFSCCIQVSLPFLYLLVCIGVLLLFTTWNLIETSWFLDLLSVFFLVILKLKKVIVITVFSRASIMSMHMLPSLGPLLSFLQGIFFFRSHQIWYLPYHFQSFLNPFLSPFLIYRFIRDPKIYMLYSVIQPPTHHLSYLRLWLPPP